MQIIDFFGYIGSILSLTTVYFMTKKNINGMYIGFCSNIFWVGFGLVGGFWYIVMINFIYALFTIRGLKYWKEEQ